MENFLNHLKDVVLEHWQDWNLGRKPSKISLIRRSSTWLGAAGKEVYLIFRKGEDRPAVVAKTVLSRQYGASIHKEASNTWMVWDISTLRPNMSRPIAVEIIKGLPVYFEEAIPGVAFPEKVMFCMGKKP